MSDFLYPFLAGGAVDVEALLEDLTASADAKAARSRALQEDTLERVALDLEATARAMAARFDAGGRVLAFGNGGSATDAAGLVALFSDPPSGTALPARCLAQDSAVLTALGNDVGFDLVFARQLIAHGRTSDIALGMSTSGNSRNLLIAFAEAKRQGMFTVGIAGYDGGEMARSDAVDRCLVVRGDSVHRVQETQSALGFALWQATQRRCAGETIDG